MMDKPVEEKKERKKKKTLLGRGRRAVTRWVTGDDMRRPKRGGKAGDGGAGSQNDARANRLEGVLRTREQSKRRRHQSPCGQSGSQSASRSAAGAEGRGKGGVGCGVLCRTKRLTIPWGLCRIEKREPVPAVEVPR